MIGWTARGGEELNLKQLVERQKKYFYTGKTKDISFRLKSLEKLANAIV